MASLFDPEVLAHENPATAVGMDKYDGMIVAYLPPLDEVMTEVDAGDLTLFARDNLVIDGFGEDAKPVKWWRIKNATSDVNWGWRAGGGPPSLDIVEPIWRGPVHEFSLAKLPDVPRPSEKHRLHMRAYSHGPWVRLETPYKAPDDVSTQLAGETGTTKSSPVL